MPKLLLIDGHSLAFRAYHALPANMATRSGEPTNATYGFVSMLLNVLKEQQPDYVAVAFDVGKTFRHEQFPDYKGHRERMPDDLAHQVDRIQQVVEALNIPIFTRDGYEADDVLGTLAKQAEAQGVETLIVTGDRDIVQCVTDRVHVLTSGRKFSDVIVYTPETVRERWGLAPRQLIDLKALLGDTSDNVPGVKGIGEKTATTLVQTYGSLEGIYDHLDEVTPKRVQEALAQGREAAFLSKRLVTIVTDVPGVALDLEACRLHDYDQAEVTELFRELEFRTLMDRLPPSTRAAPPAAAPSGQLALFGEEAPAEAAAEPSPYPIVNTQEALDRLVRTLQSAELIAFDTETTAVDAQQAELVGIAVAWGEGQSAYIPVGHKLSTADGQRTMAGSPATVGMSQLPLPVVLTALKPVLEGEGSEKAAHNAEYDLTLLLRHGIRVGGPLFDTMIAQWLIDPASRNLGLKNLAWQRLGVDMTPITDLIGSGKNQGTMDTVPIAAAARYAAADTDMTWRLVPLLRKDLDDLALTRLFREVEMPLVPVLVDMQMAGVLLDVPFLQQMSADLRRRLGEIEAEIYRLVGYSFNINSTQQLSDVLFGTLGLPTAGLKKTQSGHYSTAAGVLEGFRGLHPVIDLILEHRQISKLLSTYVDALPTMVNPRTGRVHTSFNQTGAETGRLSSSNPNLQNIPVRTELGREIRRAFIAPPGAKLLAADYSQVELRILAHISQDQNMLAAFRAGADIHRTTAAIIYGVPPEQVTPEQRSIAKMVNFATSYGVSAYGLSSRTNLSRGEAQAFLDAYFRTYPGIRRYVDETIRKAYEQGYVETLLGRRRYFPILKNRSGGQAERQQAERAAINHPIQGTAADIIKIAMVRLHAALRERGLVARMLLQVHDELVLEVPDQELDVVAPLVRQTMEAAYPLDAALKVDMEVGPNWFEMEKV
ncbi:MAG: DNA polymerase I [Caldilineales bacterium]|nr:DNA polymerase I [Caldilineales bacterium]MDW8317720.1 DNA polymerase I [Anaerolineae bacterium]